jgi:hypothetical protein
MVAASTQTSQANATPASRASVGPESGCAAGTLAAESHPIFERPMNSPVAPVLQGLTRIIRGKESRLKWVVACLLARGHLLGLLDALRHVVSAARV